MGEENKDSSIFNMGIAMLKRIDFLLTECAVASSKRDLTRWFDLLMTLKREVEYLFSSDEKETNLKNLKGIHPIDNEYRICLEKSRLISPEKYTKLYNLLNEYETFLRSVFCSRDMLIVKKADINRAMTDL